MVKLSDPVVSKKEPATPKKAVKPDGNKRNNKPKRG